jgi:mxaJ protein
MMRLVAGLLLLMAIGIPAQARTLRVCADPNNMPYSNERLEGFENKIVDLVTEDLGADVEYTWWAQRRGFIRNTLKEGLCDLIPGVPSNMEMLATTRPYYRSTYVFVTAAERHIAVKSFDDAILRDLRIGVQIIGDDFSNAPPAHALSRRGIVENVRGYLVYGDYRENDPTSAIVKAVAKGDLDLAVIWGPQAGYFAQQQTVALDLVPVAPRIDGPLLPMVFDISMGVRREDRALKQEIDRALAHNRQAIDRILAGYGVPRAEPRSR